MYIRTGFYGLKYMIKLAYTAHEVVYNIVAECQAFVCCTNKNPEAYDTFTR